LYLGFAEKVFFSKGFNQATMDDVAETAEYSKGTLYLYFKSKEDLYFAIFLRGMNMLLEKIKKQLDENVSGLENLKIMGRTFVNFAFEKTNYMEAMISFENKEFSSGAADDNIDTLLAIETPISLLNEQVENGIKDGSLRSDFDALTLATTLWSQTLGILTVINKKNKVIEKQGISIDDLIAMHFQTLINGIKK
jgi:AcrR family transcriptional regulator